MLSVTSQAVRRDQPTSRMALAMQKNLDMDQNSTHPGYVLITPARNEEAFLEKTIESMIHQTLPPVKWVIVDDASTDRTPEIINRYLEKYPWIEMIQMPPRRDRSFAAKVHSFNAGYQRVKDLPYEIIGNLDADISFDEDFLAFLVGRFAQDPGLGVAGTIFREAGYSSGEDSFEGQNHVAGQCQLFRRRCFEEIGGYIPHRAGGIDWMAVTTARMKGWKTKSFREKSFFHHRPMGTAERGAIASAFSYGQKDYYLGGHPIWELFRVGYRIIKRPYFFAGFALGLGYCWAFLRRTPRPVSRELMTFHRQEQMTKLKAIFKTLRKLKRVDNFNVTQG
jgi:glycosyltransferase involved in cell wall biosynthesis